MYLPFAIAFFATNKETGESQLVALPVLGKNEAEALETAETAMLFRFPDSEWENRHFHVSAFHPMQLKQIK